MWGIGKSGRSRQIVILVIFVGSNPTAPLLKERLKEIFFSERLKCLFPYKHSQDKALGLPGGWMIAIPQG